MILTLGQAGESYSIAMEIVKEAYYIEVTTITTTKQRNENSRGFVFREMTLTLAKNGSIEFPEVSIGIALVKSSVRRYYRVLVPSFGNQTG